MKRLLTIAAIMLACVSLHAQIPNTLTGTWHIKGFQYTYKSFTPTHFSIIEADSTSGIITNGFFGSYT